MKTISIKNTISLLSIFLTVVSCKNASKKEAVPQEPIHVSSEAGKKWNVFGVAITGKILSEETDGAYTVIMTETPPAGGPPKHVHKHEDELFYVLKGTYEFYCGDQTMTAKKGDMVRLPKGIPHHFKNIDSITGITMNTITPGGFEHFFDEIAAIAKQRKPTRQEIDSIANNYGMRFLKN